MGLGLMFAAGAWLLAPWHNASALPMVVCLKSDDVACSSNFLFGRNRAEDLGYLLAGCAGSLGAAAFAASVTWTLRLRSSAPVS